MVRLFALLTAGKGSRTGMYTEIFVSWILQLFAFWFFNFNFFLEKVFFTQDIYPHPHPRPTTSTHYPRPTTFSYTQFFWVPLSFCFLWVLLATILVTLVGTEVVFSAPSMLVFASGYVRSKKINTEMEGAQLFVALWVQHEVSRLNVARIVGFFLIVAGKITKPWALSDSLVDTRYMKVITVQ